VANADRFRTVQGVLRLRRRHLDQPRDQGFSLVEIVIAVVLVGILSAVVVVGVGSLTSTGAAATCSASLDAARAASTVHLTSTGAAADGFDDLVDTGALTIPSGVTIQAGGRAVGTGSWTLVLDGTSLTCLTGPLWTPQRLGPDVVLWLDATTIGGTDGSTVGTWPSQASVVRPVSQATTTFRPTLTTTGIGGLPAVRFDGTDDELTFDGNFLVGTDFTVAAVTARESGKSANYYLGGMGGTPATSFILGYEVNTLVRYSHRINGVSVPTAGFTAPTATVHVTRSDATGRGLWLDGTLAGSVGPLPLTAWTGAAVGRDTVGRFAGLVGEIVMVTSSLPTAERQRLEGYLAWKWGTVSSLPPGHPYVAAPPIA
jgi:prepilin-type N-terminal cleavage/methylation domain-containing protein